MAINFGLDSSNSGNNLLANSFVNSGNGTAANITSFTAVGTTTWTPPAGITSVSYLVVAGGGSGGGGSSGGGGGAGGYLTGTLSVTPGTAYTVTVGAGGQPSNVNGSNSVFASITSIGGGNGGGTNGGSGGGQPSGGGFPTGYNIGLGTAGQGNNGGAGNGGANYPGGGGGGAGGVGGAASAGVGGAGGLGLASSIGGFSTFYAGGGGGGGQSGGTAGAGGSGVGGAGSMLGGGSAGATNTGSGGGGCGFNGAGQAGGAGATGIVIIAYILADSISTNDSMVDVPGIPAVTSQIDIGGVQRGNYPTWNPLHLTINGGTKATLSNGNLTAAFTATDYCYVPITFGADDTSPMYCEFNINALGAFSYGIQFLSSPVGSSTGTGIWRSDGAAGQGITTSTFTTGDLIGIAISNRTATCYKNGVLVGTISSPNYNRYIMLALQGIGASVTANFGQKPFSMLPPAGFKSLNTANLPNPVIKRPSDHFDVKLWTGNGNGLTVGNTPKQLATAAINKSLRFKTNTRPYLTRTMVTPTNNKIWTWSAWVKRGTTTAVSGTSYHRMFASGINGDESIRFASDSIQFHFNSTSSGNLITTNIFRSTTSWYHIVVAVDTTQLATFNRVKIYVNGAQITAYSTGTFPAQNYNTSINAAGASFLGSAATVGEHFDGYMADVHFVDGQQLSPLNFGQYDANNNWAPISYTGTYGINGFKLNFNDARSPTTAAYDVSGNGNHWTPSTLGGWNTAPTIENAPNVLYYGTPGTYTWTAPAGVTSVNYLVVAGGAGGGGGYPTITSGGGGGAGGMLTGTLSVTPSTSYTVTVGSGGSAGVGGGSGSSGGAGANSVFASITSTGGGYGAWNQRVGGNGGSGGGGSGPVSAGSFAGGTGTAGQGNAGGTGGQYSAGGGGGAGGVGQNAPGGSPNGQGGVGLTSSITGVSVYYAGGGGGAGALGGLGGGGTGSDLVASSVFAGTDGLGGGGGGGGNPTTTGAKGGSGVVILSYTNAASYVGNGANSSNNNDSLLDAPVDKVDANGNAVGAYATWNIASTVSEGGLKLFGTTASSSATLAPTTGKWYAEFTCIYGTVGDTNTFYINGGNIGLYGSSGNAYQTSWGAYGSSYGNNDIIGCAVDMDAGTVTFYKNGVAQPTLRGNANGPLVFMSANSASNSNSGYLANFGQSPFAYTPPAGFKALNTKNLKDVVAYNLPDNTGNFVNTPDLVWYKGRSAATPPALEDTVRGPGNVVRSDVDAANAAVYGISQFLPNGFSLGSDQVGNTSGTTYVGWAWNRGTVPGFDVVQYSGSGVAKTVPHNLGQAPKFMMVKKTSATQAWSVWHTGIAATDYLVLNTTALPATLATMWNSQAPGNYSFSVGTDGNTNADSASYIAYLWAEVPGFSKMGTYTGNGVVDGPFLYTGFRPKYVIIKVTTTTANNWVIQDTLRSTGNPISKTLLAAANAELDSANYNVDFVSNGFKVRATDNAWNGSGLSYIYAAFAESPFKYANAR